MQSLVDLLKQKRPSFDPRTYAFFRKFIHNYVDGYAIREDKHHNFMVTVGESNVCFTAHYDTVHRDYGDNEVYFDAKDNYFYTASGARGTPLGADDAAGIYIMLELIKAKVPGFYVFFADEESGGVGSNGFDKNLVNNIDIMISLDRRGTTDVVIEQAACGQCASEIMGDWLVGELSSRGLASMISYEGSFTDSANFAGIIPECLNLSVGYENEHTKYEILDTVYLHKLISALKSIDFSHAPVTGVLDTEWDDDSKTSKASALYDFVYENPQLVAQYLDMIGVTLDEISFTMDSDIPQEWEQYYVSYS